MGGDNGGLLAGGADVGLVPSRRRFLGQLAAGALLALAPGLASAAARQGHRTLRLENIHTGETLNVAYVEQGRYLADALAQINHFFRDYHSGDSHPMDLSLLAQLSGLRAALATDRPFQVLSGYRSPATNAGLRKARRGVAKHSLHMAGRAVDIRVAGVELRHLRNAALALRMGGVGYYPSANFVHLDSGGVRNW